MHVKNKEIKNNQSNELEIISHENCKEKCSNQCSFKVEKSKNLIYYFLSLLIISWIIYYLIWIYFIIKINQKLVLEVEKIIINKEFIWIMEKLPKLIKNEHNSNDFICKEGNSEVDSYYNWESTDNELDSYNEEYTFLIQH